MKRGGSLKRSPFKRTKPMRRRSRSTSYSRRPRDIVYLLFVKTLPCFAHELGPCSGVVESDHAGRRGWGQKADDDTAIPLCTGHHHERGNFCGAFKRWNQARMREWLLLAIARTRAAAESAAFTGQIVSSAGLTHEEIERAIAMYTGGDVEA